MTPPPNGIAFSCCCLITNNAPSILLGHVMRMLHTLYDTKLLSTASGQPLYFTTEPDDILLYQTSLVLNCSVQGDPSPTITWYRGDPPALVPDGYVLNGSLVIPTVVEGVDASRGGIPYHCRATSDQFGTIRSRTATVYYACEFTIHNKRQLMM